MSAKRRFQPRDRVGAWTIIRYLPGSICECYCACGTVKEIAVDSLSRGRSKSCGCLKVENCKETKKESPELFAKPGRIMHQEKFE